MSNQDSWVPNAIRPERANVARVYDFLLGGHHNFEVDRQTAKKMAELYPDVYTACQSNRALLRRVVNMALDEGIDQFIDIGSGLPTVGNTHSIVHGRIPNARVVYVDIDSVAVAHSRAMLEDIPYATAIQADAADPSQILDHPEVQDLLDFDRPMAVLFVAVLHMVPDDEKAKNTVHVLRDEVAPGSYVAVTFPTTEGAPAEAVKDIQRLYAARSGAASKMRNRADMEEFMEGLELVEPGIVFTPRWRPESDEDPFFDHPERSLTISAVGRKP